jgi:hypothetical protein
MTFNGNLDAAGTLIQGPFRNPAAPWRLRAGPRLATDLRNSSGASLGLTVGTSLSISGSVGGC